jgi:hypothetical protein
VILIEVLCFFESEIDRLNKTNGAEELSTAATLEHNKLKQMYYNCYITLQKVKGFSGGVVCNKIASEIVEEAESEKVNPEEFSKWADKFFAKN